MRRPTRCNECFYDYPIPERMRCFVSHKPFTSFKAVKQNYSQRLLNGKPRGLWYSVGPAWVDWLSSEMPRWYAKAKYLYEIKINTESVLVVNNERVAKQIDKVTSVNGSRYDRDWSRVERDFDGIEYMSAWLPDLWDVPSGVIWSPHGIVSIRLVYKRPPLVIKQKPERFVGWWLRS